MPPENVSTTVAIEVPCSAEKESIKVGVWVACRLQAGKSIVSGMGKTSEPR